MAQVIVTKSSHRLSEADIERLADEAERGFDLSKWRHARGRRPLETGATEHSPRIAVRVPPTLHRKATARATAEGRTLSDVIRELLWGYAGR